MQGRIAAAAGIFASLVAATGESTLPHARGGSLAAERPSVGQGPRVDTEGVPLPDGVVARLGSTRFRYTGTPVCDPLFSPDGLRLAVPTDESIDVFETATGRLLHRFRPPVGRQVRLVRFLADGARLAVGSSGRGQPGVLTVFELAEGRVVLSREFPGQRRTDVIGVSRDSDQVLVNDSAGVTRWWDLRARCSIRELRSPEGSPVAPAVGRWLAVMALDRMELRDSRTGRLVAPFPDAGPLFASPKSVALAPDGRLALLDADGTGVALLDARGTVGLRVLPNPPWSESLVFSPSGRHLAALGMHATFVWDLQAPDDKAVAARLPPAGGAGFSPGDDLLALADHGLITLWSTDGWKRSRPLPDPPTSVVSVHFSPCGSKVFGQTKGGWLVWPTTGGRASALNVGKPSYRPWRLSAVSADRGTAFDVTAERGQGGVEERFALRVTDLLTGKARAFPLVAEPDWLRGAGRDGRYVWGRSAGGETVVWEAASGRPVRRPLDAPAFELLGADLAPGSPGLKCRLLGEPEVWVSGGDPTKPAYRAVSVSGGPAGRPIRLDPLPWFVDNATFSQDSQRLLIQGRLEGSDRPDHERVGVWDTLSGRRLLTWPPNAGRGPEAVSAAACLSSDARSLLVGSRTGRLSLVEIATGTERATFWHAGPVSSVAFNSEETRAVASSPDAPIYVWDLVGDPGPWGQPQAETIWSDLASADARLAFTAMRKLRAHPRDAATFLKERLAGVQMPAEPQVAGWLARLNAPSFGERQDAERELAEAAELIRPRLEADRRAGSPDVARRLGRVLDPSQPLTPGRLRQVRACEVLERIATSEAEELLRHWASGPDGSRLTVEAKASLARLAQARRD